MAFDFFTYTTERGHQLMWDVTRAKAEVAAGHTIATVPIAPSELAEIAARNDWTAARVAIADPTLPGIGAPMVWEGSVIYILIDGTHRAVRAHQTDGVFSAHLLTDEAARRCLLSGPPALMPWFYPVVEGGHIP